MHRTLTRRALPRQRPAWLTHALLLLLLTLVSADVMDAGAAPTPGMQQLGTISATIDGEEQTWYLLAGDGQDPATTTAGWMMLPDASGPMVVLVGFDTPTPPFDTFERDENGVILNYGEYAGSILTLGIGFDESPAPVTLTFPDATVSRHIMSFVPGADAAYHMVDEGTLDVTAVSRMGGAISIAGTFSGTFRPFSGDSPAITITGGAFNGEDLQEISLPGR